MRLLIEAGANINARNKTGQTPLHKAVRLRRGNVAQMLLHHGADVEARNDREMTPLLEMKMSERDLTMLDLLIDAGANLDVKDQNGQNVLH